MKRIFVFATMLLLANVAVLAQDYGLPELHVIKTVTLSPSYSCRSREDSQAGYAVTALFVSDYSKRRNSPDLLFNGACRSDDYFQSSTAGDDMALVADLGTEVSVESLSAHLAFNKANVHSYPAYSKFAKVAKVEPGHTYVVLLNKGEIRGLLVFKVTDYVPNQRVTLRYAVKEYQILDVKAQSPGFHWEKRNVPAVEETEVAEGKRQN